MHAWQALYLLIKLHPQTPKLPIPCACLHRYGVQKLTSSVCLLNFPAWFWRQSLSMDLELTVSAKLAVQGATGFSCPSQLCNVDAPLLTEGKAWQSDRANWVDSQQG